MEILEKKILQKFIVSISKKFLYWTPEKIFEEITRGMHKGYARNISMKMHRELPWGIPEESQHIFFFAKTLEGINENNYVNISL